MKTLFRMIQLMVLLALLMLPAPTLAQSEVVCEADVIVQADDWLSKIAAKFYGDPLAYPAIAEATNAKAADDDSYAAIADVNLIEPGWKLCIPAQTEATAAPEQAAQAGLLGVNLAELPEPVVPITFLHLNDVYEITPVSGGAEGGLARVATLRKQLLAENPNTYLALAGDLFSPSALGTAKVDGERLAGQQIVAVMNNIGLDFMTFGNHEFDLSEERFRKRMAESEFTWFSSNVFEANGEPFPGVAPNHVFTATGPNGQSVRVGMFGVTLGSNPKEYVSYTDPFVAAEPQIAALKEQADIILGLTHVSIEDDIKLSQQFPDIDLIMGGHEHENMSVQPAAGLAPIYKADANARTAYIHTLLYNTETGALETVSRLQPITSAIPDDPEAAQEVEQWTQIAFDGFRASGFNPEAVVTTIDVPLDGLEASVRNVPTRLTQLIADGMRNNVPGAEAALFNGGSIRIDDLLPPGAITEYDIIRVLPFGDDNVAVEMSGALLNQTLIQGRANVGKGGFLQTTNNITTNEAGNWLINGEVLDEARTYKIALNSFLLTGNEQGLDFLTPDNPDLTVIETYDDIRKTTIAQLRLDFPPE